MLWISMDAMDAMGQFHLDASPAGPAGPRGSESSKDQGGQCPRRRQEKTGICQGYLTGHRSNQNEDITGKNWISFLV